MRNKSLTPFVFVLIYLALVFASTYARGEENGPSGWHTRDLPFRVLSIVSNGSKLWACGTDEVLAVSSDGGEHWQIKHQVNDGGLLLNVVFTNEQFGYAAGTGGRLLMTEDAGETWTPHSAGSATILQVSFADKQHGLIRTSTSLLFTTDGGANWTPVSAVEAASELKKFPYIFALVALDAQHMAVMLKQGSAQYEPQMFLITDDSGKSWHVVGIPNVTLYSFLRVQDKYWTVGTEVIHKDQPGGGYGVPVALSSSDGVKWEHSSNDLSSCKLEMCTVCNTRGCLSGNGSIINLFASKTTLASFPSNKKLTPEWAATNSEICFLGGQLECAGVQPVAQAPSNEGPAPTVVSPGPLGSDVSQGPHCISCPMDKMLIDKNVQGPFTIRLAL